MKPHETKPTLSLFIRISLKNSSGVIFLTSSKGSLTVLQPSFSVVFSQRVLVIILFGAEPVRILRGEDGVSKTIRGLYPCGEGAGYAGGIMSAATDGIKQAENVIQSICFQSHSDKL